MYLNITDTGTPINSELADYINANFEGIGYNQIYVTQCIDPEGSTKSKRVDITYPGFSNMCPNTICICDDDLNQNVINWLNTL